MADPQRAVAGGAGQAFAGMPDPVTGIADHAGRGHGIVQVDRGPGVIIAHTGLAVSGANLRQHGRRIVALPVDAAIALSQRRLSLAIAAMGKPQRDVAALPHRAYFVLSDHPVHWYFTVC